MTACPHRPDKDHPIFPCLICTDDPNPTEIPRTMTFLVSYTHGPDHAVYVRAFHDIDKATRFIAGHTHLPASMVDLELRMIRNRVELLQVTHESRRLHSTLIVTATPTATDQETTDKHAR